MATAAQQAAFTAQMTPLAQQASAATGLNAQLILAQWANETAWGTNFAEANNIGNIGVYGGGPNPSYGTLQEGVQAYINFINNNPRYAPVKAAGANNPAQQAILLGESGYASGGYNNGAGPGSDLLQIMGMQAPAGSENANVATTSSATAANSTLQQSSITEGTGTNAATYTGTAQQTSALETIEQNLLNYGFNPSQTAQLTQWAWGEITNNVDPSQIAIDLPNQPAFQAAFPGFAPANAELEAQGLPAVSVQQYQQYQTQAMAMAQAAGLPPGFINSQNVGQLIGGNVSASELSSRINNAMVLAYQSTPEQQEMFNSYFGTKYGDSGQGGLTPGQIASIALDPNVAEPLIAQQITAAQIGGASVTAGVGALQASTATTLAAAGITPAQATNAFQNLAPLAPLETARPGEGGEAAQGVVSADQMVTGTLLGNTGDQRALQQAKEVAAAPFAGGGGYQAGSKGAVGTGSASSSGAGQG